MVSDMRPAHSKTTRAALENPRKISSPRSVDLVKIRRSEIIERAEISSQDLIIMPFAKNRLATDLDIVSETNLQSFFDRKGMVSHRLHYS